MTTTGEIFQRSQLLLGGEAMTRLAAKRVLIFGVGGVGSWCAEALVRTGITNITIVDNDIVNASNINRQLMATVTTIGKVKVEVLRERLLTINPEAQVVAINKTFCSETAPEFDFDRYDYIIDAIDSLKDKANLILLATKSRAKLFSSMGAALKIDPSRIRVAEFWKVQGDPLARSLRKWFKRNKRYPACKFKCVFSDELLKNKEPMAAVEGLNGQKRPNGTLMHITAVFGLTLASLVINDATHDND